MNEMIERVADAMKAAMVKPHTDPWAHAARAAIEAMREPPDSIREIMNGHARNGFVNWDDYHEAMIDAALTPQSHT